LQVTLPEKTGAKLRYAQELLSHAIPSRDIAEVLDRALDVLIPQLERERFAATSEPRPGRRTKSARHIPAHVRREVWKRDRGQCTFVSDNRHRCESRTRLEFDHVLPKARGGEATPDNLRLRCRAHNQHEAERAFGASFMPAKREQARERTAESRTKKPSAHVLRPALAPEDPNSVIPWLRALGFNAAEARRVAPRCDAIPESSLEERVKMALATLSPGRKYLFASLAGPS
jgi:5-methylcytosine-specific restriction endonuclease McrA